MLALKTAQANDTSLVEDTNNQDDRNETKTFFPSDDNNGLAYGRTFFLLHLLKEKIKKLHALEKIEVTPLPPFQGCVCVSFYLCGPNGTIISDGTGAIDIRQVIYCDFYN